MRPASRTAAWNESAWRIPTAKNSSPSWLRRCAPLAREPVGDERLDDEAAAERVECEERREPHDDRARTLEPALVRDGELEAGVHGRREAGRHDERECGGDRVGEQPALRAGVEQRRPARDECAERPGEGCDRARGSEEARRRAIARGVGEHRLLERGERARVEDVGRQRARQCGEQEQRQRAGERERCPRQRHQHEQRDVRAPAPDAVAVPREHERDQGGAREHRGEDEPDRRPGQAAALERDADQDAAESVDGRAEALDGQDPPRVSGQAGATSWRHQAYRAS